MMIGNIIISIITNICTSLQLALGVLLRTPSVIDPRVDFKVCAPYHEVIRFKASAAAATAKNSSAEGLFSENDGLIQFMSDNFDVNIHSPNGLQTTHAIALLATLCGRTQAIVPDSSFLDDVIPRVSINKIKEELIRYRTHLCLRPQKPSMPDEDAYKPSFSQSLVYEQNVSQI